MFDPTQPVPVSVEPILEEANPSISEGIIKKSAKRKTSLSKSKPKKRTKVSSSSQQEGTHRIQAESGLPNTPPTHSSKVPIDVSKTQAHTHGESAHNPPSPSQLSDVGVEQSSLPLEQNNMSHYLSILLLHTHTLRNPWSGPQAF